MSNFSQLNLNANINKAILKCGYQEPTKIQLASIPPILAGQDIIASSQTGSGKTAAFVLPVLHFIAKNKISNKPQVLILTPTRELSSQITKAIATYGKFLNFSLVSLVGGMPYHHQIKDLARGANIIVATPGRLLDHINSKRVDLSDLKTLILDEADRMLDMGFIDDIKKIIAYTSKERQTLLFSATIDNRLSKLVSQLMKNPLRIDLSTEKNLSPLIKQELYKVQNLQQKSLLLKHFLGTSNFYKAIIFSATKINADKIAQQLQYDGFAAAALHGDLKQKVRNRTIEQFRKGKIQYLVATDVASRGIDISDITHVINFDLPRFCEDYVHRIGRTGRAGKSGVAISFVLPHDNKILQRIERFIGKRLQLQKDILLNKTSVNDPQVVTDRVQNNNVKVERKPFKKPRKEKRFHGKQEYSFQKKEKNNHFKKRKKSVARSVAHAK